MATILDVVDNYLTAHGQHDFSTMSGHDIAAFGERVTEFAAAHIPVLDSARHPVYLGGWPSASFHAIDSSLLLSSLLYSGQVLVRDPLSDWFAKERFLNTHTLAGERGFWHPEDDGEERTRRTRAFLNFVVPGLDAMRPLIEAGIVVPVPAEPLYYERRHEIQRLQEDLMKQLLDDPLGYADQFSAEEIATENTVRGYFVFAPGPERAPQLKNAINHGLRFFSREYSLANTYGATYTAPFRHEQHLCRAGIGGVVSGSQRVTEALLRSGMPVYTGLTPALIRSVHDDDAFAAFRATLHNIYQGTPTDDPTAADAYVRDQEQALLAPLLREAEAAGSDGFLSRLGAALTDSKYVIAAALAADITFQTAGFASAVGAAGAVADQLRRSGPQGERRIWASLVRHERTAITEMRGVQVEGETSKQQPAWGIPDTPSMAYTVSAGAIVLQGDPGAPGPIDDDERLRLGNYRSCGCGSGLKFKFCCGGL